jgi:phage terminase large subunit GpA-like protein
VDSANNLQTQYPGRGVEGTIQAGLEDLVSGLLQRDFERAGGAGLMRIGKMLVDAGKWPAVIAAVKRKCGGSVMDLSRGVGLKAGVEPMSARKRKPGERMDPLGHWYYPSTVGTREFPTAVLDVNHWKSFVHGGFLTAAGDPGAMSLFGAEGEQHGLFAAHLTAETYTITHGRGRDVDEWTQRPTRPDNHWFDALVYAASAASIAGIVPAGLSGPRGRIIRRTRMSYDQIVARRGQTGGQP